MPVVGLSPALGYVSALVLPDALSALPLMIALLLVAKSHPVGTGSVWTSALAGALVGAGVWLRPNVVLLPPFLSLVILLVLGCLLEGSTILLVIVPIMIPTARALGIDMVHFGVVVVFNVMIGLVTPPYGLLLFIISNISETPLRPIIRDTMPFVLAMIVALIIITFIPETVLWLPRQLGYKG